VDSIESRKAALRREIEDTRSAVETELARKERYLAELEAMPEFADCPDGSVLALVIRWGNGRSRPYVVIGYKVGDQWFLTGKNSPNGISSGELATWLMTGSRRLERVEILAEVQAVQVSMVDLGALLGMMDGGR
jgi:hypothetical protein